MNTLSPAEQQALATRYRVTATIILSLVAGLGVFMLIGNLVALVSVREVAADLHNQVRIVAVTVVIIAVVGVIVMRRVLLSRRHLRMSAGNSVQFVLGRLSIVSIIGAAIGEAIGLIGLTGSLLTGDTTFSWRLGLGGLILIGLSFPRKGEWERLVVFATRSDRQGAENEYA